MKNALALFALFFLTTLLFLGSCGKKEETKTETTTTSKPESKDVSTNPKKTTSSQPEINKDDPMAWAKGNADKFIALLKDDEISVAIEGCHPKAFVNASPKEWNDFFNNLFDEFGIIESYEVYDEGSDYGEGEAGEGYYYEVLYEVKHVEITLYTKIVLFHEKEGEEPQVLGYFYDQTKANNQKTTK